MLDQNLNLENKKNVNKHFILKTKVISTNNLQKTSQIKSRKSSYDKNN